jgi:hypothetical protein
MKSFNVEDYLKPSISKMGLVLSKKNRFFVTSLMKIMKKPIESEEFPYYKNFKFPKVNKISKPEKEGRVGTSSFKSSGRRERRKEESPPLGWYSPNFDFLAKRSQITFISKPKTPEPVNKRLVITPEPQPVNIPTGPKRITGIPFEKQLKRKSWLISDTPHEKRFEELHSIELINPKRVHSFQSYTPRNPYFPLPDPFK